MQKKPPMVYLITTPDRETAIKLASGMVKQKIAACANIIEKITSIYWWEDKINTDQECLIVVKTTKTNSDKLFEFVKNHHPYEVPECIGIPITNGSEPYLQWIIDSTSE